MGGSWFGHRDKDVKPFVWAAQLDGNPVDGEQGFDYYLNLTAPIMYEGSHLDTYMHWRPATANAKPILPSGACP
jgi:hypothetical protein